MPSRRTLRTATRPCSAYLCASLTSSVRRSLVSSGIGMRIIWPSGAGLSPRPASRIALATETTRPLSQTLTVSRRGSGALTVPTWLSGIRCPYASTITGSRKLTEARPVLSPCKSFLSASSAPCMRFSSSLGSAVISALILDDCEGPLPAHCGGERAGLVDVEYNDGNAVLPGERNRRSVHDLQVAREHVHIGESVVAL